MPQIGTLECLSGMKCYRRTLQTIASGTKYVTYLQPFNLGNSWDTYWLLISSHWFEDGKLLKATKPLLVI